MKLILLLLTVSLGVQAETLRVSRALDRPGVGAEAMRITKNGYTLIYHVEGEAIVTEKDILAVKVVAKRKGILEVVFNPAGAKKLAEATKGAAGQLRLAILVDEKLVTVPLVQTALSDTVWISGLEALEKEELGELAKALVEGGKKGAEEKAE